MPGPAVNYRSDDNTRWGAGLGRKLAAAEVDVNIWNLAQAIVALQNDRPQPNNIESVNVVGSAMNIVLGDGTVIGPLQLPVLAFNWRRAWAPFTPYAALDTFTVEGFGIYMVRENHTSGANFDPTLVISGAAAYQQIWAFGDGSNTGVVYDIGFFYQGLISDSASTTLYCFASPRTILVPAAGNQHQAFLVEAPSTEAQVFPIFHNGAQFGQIDFEIGQNAGTVTIDADETINILERLEVGAPPLSDATAEGLSITFAAQRVLTP